MSGAKNRRWSAADWINHSVFSGHEGPAESHLDGSERLRPVTIPPNCRLPQPLSVHRLRWRSGSTRQRRSPYSCVPPARFWRTSSSISSHPIRDAPASPARVTVPPIATIPAGSGPRERHRVASAHRRHSRAPRFAQTQRTGIRRDLPDRTPHALAVVPPGSRAASGQSSIGLPSNINNAVAVHMALLHTGKVSRCSRRTIRTSTISTK